MSWTIKQVLEMPVSTCMIEQPVEGEVKYAKDPSSNEKGPSQFFVLKDATGEIGVSYYAADKDGRGFSPVQVGDKIRIQATMGGKGKLAGASRGEYTKDDKKHAKIIVYGDRLKNHRVDGEEEAGKPVQTPAGARSAAAPAHHPAMSETEAVEAYWRIFERHAAKLSRFIEAEDLDGFVRTAPPEMLDAAHRATVAVFGAILSGHVAPDTKRPADPAPKPATTQPRQDDPFEGLDDEDIPFAVFLPLLLPLLYFAASGGFA